VGVNFLRNDPLTRIWLYRPGNVAMDDWVQVWKILEGDLLEGWREAGGEVGKQVEDLLAWRLQWEDRLAVHAVLQPT